MEDDNEDNLKNKEDLHIAGRHTALDIFRFAVFLVYLYRTPSKGDIIDFPHFGFMGHPNLAVTLTWSCTDLALNLQTYL